MVELRSGVDASLTLGRSLRALPEGLEKLVSYKGKINLALHPSGVAKSSTSFGWGKGWNVTSAGWQVTLCDPIWHVSSSSGVATSVSELRYPRYFTLLTLLYKRVNTTTNRT